MGWYSDWCESKAIEYQESMKKRSEAAWLHVAQLHECIQFLEFENRTHLAELFRKMLQDFINANKEDVE